MFLLLTGFTRIVRDNYVFAAT